MKHLSNSITSLLFSFVLAMFFAPVLGATGFLLFLSFILAIQFIPLKKNVLWLNNTNNWSARQSFEHARHMFATAMLDKFAGNYAASKRWADSLKLSQSEIRCEVQLVTTTTQFVFGLTTVQNNTTGVLFNTEQRLNQQDSLCVNEYGIFVRKPASATSTIDRLLTFANANIFTTSNVATALEGTFYSHGKFSVKVNNDVIMPYRGLFNHLYVPQTQLSGVTASSTVAAYEDQIRGAEDGFITAEPNIVLVGSKNYVPQIDLPLALAAVETYQRAVLILRGILAQNSTIIN
jgi:hypothetical protein